MIIMVYFLYLSKARKCPERIVRTLTVHCLTALCLLCLAQNQLDAQARSDSGPKTDGTDKNESWTSTSEGRSPSGDSSPIRTVESHLARDGRTVHKQELQRLGPDGQYEPYADSETETVQLDANTARTVERRFGRGPDGQKVLVQVGEEESRILPSGVKRVTRTTSNPDANGRLQIVQRELQETSQTSPGVQIIKTTLMTPNIDGNLRPTKQSEERQIKKDDHTLQFQRSTLQPNGNGGWQVTEVREGVITEASDKSRTEDERVLQPDANGTMTLVGRTVTKKSGNGSAQERQTSEEYSPNVPGGFGDGSLQLNRRVTTVRRKGADGRQVTEQQVEQKNAAHPDEPPELTQRTIDILRIKPDGSKSETSTVESLKANGDLGVVWVDTSNLQTAPTVQVDMNKGTTGTAVNVDTKTAKPK